MTEDGVEHHWAQQVLKQIRSAGIGDRLQTILKLDSGKFEFCMDSATSQHRMPEGLTGMVQEICADMGIPGGCIVKMAGSHARKVALHESSDLDVHIFTPHHQVTRKTRRLFREGLDIRLPELSGKWQVHRMGGKAIALRSDTDADAEIELVFKNTTFWSAPQRSTEEFLYNNKHAQGAVKALKLAFRGHWFGYMFEEFVQIICQDGLNQEGDVIFAAAVHEIAQWERSSKISTLLDKVRCMAMEQVPQDGEVEEDVKEDLCEMSLYARKVLPPMLTLPVSIGFAVRGVRARPALVRGAGTSSDKIESVTTYHDNQTSVRIMVLAGERTLASDNLHLCDLRLDVPCRPRGDVPLKLSFHLCESSILRIVASNAESGLSTNTSMTINSYRVNATALLVESELHKIDDEKLAKHVDLWLSCEDMALNIISYHTFKKFKGFGGPIAETVIVARRVLNWLKQKSYETLQAEDVRQLENLWDTMLRHLREASGECTRGVRRSRRRRSREEEIDGGA